MWLPKIEDYEREALIANVSIPISLMLLRNIKKQTVLSILTNLRARVLIVRVILIVRIRVVKFPKLGMKEYHTSQKLKTKYNDVRLV